MPDSIHSENSYLYSSQLYISASVNKKQAHVPEEIMIFYNLRKKAQNAEVAWTKFEMFSVLAFCLEKMQEVACCDRF